MTDVCGNVARVWQSSSPYCHRKNSLYHLLNNVSERVWQVWQLFQPMPRAFALALSGESSRPRFRRQFHYSLESCRSCCCISRRHTYDSVDTDTTPDSRSLSGVLSQGGG